MRVTRSTVRWFCGARSGAMAGVPLGRVVSVGFRGIRALSSVIRGAIRTVYAELIVVQPDRLSGPFAAPSSQARRARLRARVSAACWSRAGAAILGVCLCSRALLAGAGRHLCAIQSPATPPGVAGTTGFAHVNQTSLRYHLAGDGPRTIVLLHELGMSLESWDDIVSEFSRAHRVLRYDLRGFGLSEKLRGAVTIDDEVDDLRALLDNLGMTEPVTLGRRRPWWRHCPALCGRAAAPGRSGHGAQPGRRRRSRESSSLSGPGRAAGTPGMRADLDATREDTYPPMLRTGHEDRFARFLALQYANDPASMAATLRMIAITEWAGTWSAIQCPAWFVAVSLYKARPIDSVRAMAAAVPRGHFEVLETGPFVPVQSPELLLPLLRRFLAATGVEARLLHGSTHAS